MKNRRGIRSTSSQEKAHCLLKFVKMVHRQDRDSETNNGQRHPYNGEAEWWDHRGNVRKSEATEQVKSGRAWQSSAIIKPLAAIPVKPFNLLFNAPLDEGRLPADRLMSTVIPVDNDGDPGKCGCYRLLILISIVLKSFGRVLRERMVTRRQTIYLW